MPKRARLYRPGDKRPRGPKTFGPAYKAGIRIDGTPEFVDATLSHLLLPCLPCLSGENLELSRARVDGEGDAEVCYIRVRSRR